MRIGVDASCWANGRGYGRFTRELLGEMLVANPSDDFVFFMDATTARLCELRSPNLERRVVAQGTSPTEAASAEGFRGPIDLLRMTVAVSRETLDVFFSPSVYSYFPVPFGLATVVTIHDAIPERFPELTFRNARARAFWNLKVGVALRQSRLVLTVSDFSRRDIARRLGIDESRIRVALEAPSIEFSRPTTPREVAAAAAAHGLVTDDRWFVYVGGFNPHKRVDTLIRAHARLAARPGIVPPKLLLVGSLESDVFHDNRAQLQALIRRSGTESLVLWTGFVPDEQLRCLHAGAAALVLPSACEGFGLPAVEAAATGCPVVATTESPLPELLAGGGLFVGPGDEAGLERALGTLLGDAGLRRRMGRAAAARVGALSWATGAAAAMGTLREAAGLVQARRSHGAPVPSPTGARA